MKIKINPDKKAEEWHKVDATLIVNGDIKQDEDQCQ